MSTCSPSFEWFAFESVSNVFCIRTIRTVDFSCFETYESALFLVSVMLWKLGFEFNRSYLRSFKVTSSLFKAFLKDLVEKNYKIRLALPSHNLRIFCQPRGGHIAKSPSVLSHLESILLKSNSSFVASFQRLNSKDSGIMNHNF